MLQKAKGRRQHVKYVLRKGQDGQREESYVLQKAKGRRQHVKYVQRKGKGRRQHVT